MPRQSVEPRFSYPFEGRRQAVEMFALFGLRPQVLLKVFGLTPDTRDLSQLGLLNAMRRMTRWIRSLPSSRLPRALVVLSTLKEVDDALTTPSGRALAGALRDEWHQMVQGDVTATRQIAARGDFETAFMALGVARPEWNRVHHYLVLLEEVGMHAQKLLRDGNVQELIASMQSRPLLRALLRPSVLESLLHVSDHNSGSPPAIAMMLDAHFGWLAGWDVDITTKYGLTSPAFQCLLPSPTRPARNATSLLFDELKRMIGVDSVAGVFGTAVPADVSADTLYDWSAGKHFPDQETISKILLSHQLGTAAEAFKNQWAAVRVVNLLGYLSQEVRRRAPLHPSNATVWALRADMFRDGQFWTWVHERYEFWLNFHRSTDITDIVPPVSTKET